MSAETTNQNRDILHAVYEVLVYGEDMGETTDWVNAYQLFNSTLRAKDNQTLAQLEERECTYLVETATMRIQWRLCTGTNGQPPYSIVEGLNQLETALTP